MIETNVDKHQVKVPEIFSEFSGAVAAFDPSQPVEHIAFEHINSFNPETPNNSDAYKFLESYVISFVEANESEDLNCYAPDAIECLLSGLYQRASTIMQENPECADLIHERLLNWHAVIYEHQEHLHYSYRDITEAIESHREVFSEQFQLAQKIGTLAVDGINL